MFHKIQDLQRTIITEKQAEWTTSIPVTNHSFPRDSMSIHCGPDRVPDATRRTSLVAALGALSELLPILPWLHQLLVTSTPSWKGGRHPACAFLHFLEWGLGGELEQGVVRMAGSAG